MYCSASFRDLKLSDSCITGTFACVEGAVVQCTQERWVGAPCSESEQCFAIPVRFLVRPHSVVSSHHTLVHIRAFPFRQTDSGIQLGCLAEQTVASLITSAGATGGVFGDQD